METAIKELLNNNGKNYILPFFWQMGASEAVLREYMGAIQGCGIQEVTLESRTHEDFAGPGWWKDVDIIMDEAKKRGMKVWILDDKRFPTGYANGAFEKPENKLKSRHFIYQNSVDLFETGKIVDMDIKNLCKFNYKGPVPSVFGMAEVEHSFSNDEVISITACRVIKGYDLGKIIDISGFVNDGRLRWEPPCEGPWRIFICYKTYNASSDKPYMNLLDDDSVQVLIDEVYQKHYDRYKDDFGKTLLGFFSDEPKFGNTAYYDFYATLGKDMPLPWSKDMPAMLEDRLGKDWQSLLPALWSPLDDRQRMANIRYAYMDSITSLVRDNFAGKIGKWCADRGVDYIGHHIEDNNAHGRLANSSGHFFRALEGQSYSGIDEIANQIVPGGEIADRSGRVHIDSEFFHYALSKLGSSLGHIDPKKKGRTMCEMFGAAGWGMSTRKMKYIIDHLLTRGINYFVPHAFSPAPFPHDDCPPHFYAHGENPLYGYFADLMLYTNRLAHIFNGGLHIAPAAILYHAEMEWCGEAMMNQKPARALTESQIDFDIIPADVFSMRDKYRASFSEGTLSINGENFRALVIPYCEFLPRSVAEFIIESKGTGFTVVFVDALPTGICDAGQQEAKRLIDGLSGCAAVSLDNLAEHLTVCGVRDIKLSKDFDKMVYYRYKKGSEIYMLANESIYDVYDGTVFLPTDGVPCEYDGFSNATRPLEYKKVPGGTEVSIRVEPYNSIVITFDAEITEGKLPESGTKTIDISKNWKASFCENKKYPDFKDDTELETLISIGDINPVFSGHTRYEKEIDTEGGDYILNIEEAYEGATIWVNGEKMGFKCFPPYRFHLRGLKDGKNSLAIDVANCLDRKVASLQEPSPYQLFVSSLRPAGIVGKVTLSKIK